MNINKNAKIILNYIFIVLFSFCISHCDKSVNSDDKLENIDCDNLRTGIINMDAEDVKYEINKLMIDLEPNVTVNDEFGHRENISLLISRLNNQCININADLICYACIKTYPPQSEIFITADSIKRIIDIITPANTNLSFVSIHEAYD
jgi:hypothetical protein